MSEGVDIISRLIGAIWVQRVVNPLPVLSQNSSKSLGATFIEELTSKKYIAGRYAIPFDMLNIPATSLDNKQACTF